MTKKPEQMLARALRDLLSYIGGHDIKDKAHPIYKARKVLDSIIVANPGTFEEFNITARYPKASVEHTGGPCRQWHIPLPGGAYIGITKREGVILPYAHDRVVTVGYYPDEDAEEWTDGGDYRVSQLAAFIDAKRRAHENR